MIVGGLLRGGAVVEGAVGGFEMKVVHLYGSEHFGACQGGVFNLLHLFY